MYDVWRSIVGTVFIVTYGRSGSTLLQRVLQTIPGICFRGENYNALEMLYRSARCAERSREEHGVRVVPEHDPWHGADGIEPARYSRKLAAVFVEEILRPAPWARWVGFKEIRYSELEVDFENYLDWIVRSFPNVHFVFNTRAADEVSKSGWWAEWDAPEVYDMVDTMDHRFAEFAQRYPDNSYNTDYRTFTENPRSLKEFFDRISEPFDEGRVRELLSERLSH